MTAHPVVSAAAWIAGVFLLGAFPTGYCMAKRLKGVDIRREGSGNIGATNVFRTVGKGAGVATLLIDALKGWLPVWLSLRYFPGVLVPVLTGLAAVSGHTWSPFLGFKGGKGVATSAGVFAALLPVPTLAALLVFVTVMIASGYVSAGSVAAAAALPCAALLWHGPSARSALALGIGTLIILRHAPNIRRLIRGEEPPFRDRHDKPKEPRTP